VLPAEVNDSSRDLGESVDALERDVGAEHKNQNKAQQVRAQAAEKAQQIRVRAAEKAPQMTGANQGKAVSPSG
jgi:hypothetical protein